jgi:DNA-binding transcriptional MocR family regulator
VAPLSFFATGRRQARAGGLVLGYAGLTPEQIADGSERLAAALRPLVKRAKRRASMRSHATC